MSKSPRHVEDMPGPIDQTNDVSGRNTSSKHEVSVPPGSPLAQTPKGSPPSPDLSGVRQSPQVQVMGKSDVEDSSRIPSSIFARTNTATPMEWSVASNESLFSIHMGNSSFSKDQAFLIGKSQELAFPNSPLNGTPPLTPSSASRPVNLEQAGTAEATNAEAMNYVMRANAEGSSEKERTSEVEPRSTTSTSRRSDGSVCSFAFPILAGEGRDGSIKVGPEHQHQEQQTETPKADPNASETKWFSCLSCCPFCH